MLYATYLVVVATVATPASAQVLATGDTLGKSKSGILVSDNQIWVDGFRLNFAYGLFARGVTDRLDLFVSAGEIATDGDAQVFAGVGDNLQLFKAAGFSVSWFNLATFPLTRREEASLVLWNPALVVSRPVGPRLFVYSGLNGLIPIGERRRGIFTPPDARFNVPIGATYAIGPWGVWGEFDGGPLKALGVGLTRVF